MRETSKSSDWCRRRRTAPLSVVVFASFSMSACSATPASGVHSEPTPAAAAVDDGSNARAGDTVGDVVIDVSQPGRAIDRRVFGTNVPAWLGPETLRSDWFRDAIDEAGVTTLRLPGGSWSNAYDWAGCEVGDEDRCYWTWAARPSDFVDLLAVTGLEGIWTVSINATAESAAAAVAFFNGDVADEHVIGVDRDGVDWGTTRQWADLRADNGHPDPAGITLWEIGNEVFGGKPDAGDQCASFGWEDVWTCDGTEYVDGDDEHDGYLSIRSAMRAVDPDIAVGAVGVADPSSWSNWGNEVIDAAGADLDFYIVHQYGFDQSPSADEAVDRPASLWPTVIDQSRDRLADHTPLAITEYNLVSFEAGDTERSMTTVANALYMADTIGQFVEGGVEIANQWNMANGTTGSGTDYGLVDATDGTPFPAFEAMRLWTRTGESLLDSTISAEHEALRVYPTRHADGSLGIVLLNLDAVSHNLSVQVAGVDGISAATIEFYAAARDPDSQTFDATGPMELVSDGGIVNVSLPAWSMSLVEIDTDG